MKKRLLSLLLTLSLLLSLLPVSASAALLPFTDVPEKCWYREYVQYVYDQGIMNGATDTTFDPTGKLTRAQFVVMLSRMDGIDTTGYTTSSFTDVRPGQWYAGAAQWAFDQGIVTGFQDGSFMGNEPIAREQMAIMIARYVASKGLALQEAEDAVTGFADSAAISGWAAEGVELMRSTGIIRGDNYGNFNPKNTATRTEAAVIFMRLDQALSSATPGSGSYAIADVTVNAATGQVTAQISTVGAATLRLELRSEDQSQILEVVSLPVIAQLQMEEVTAAFSNPMQLPSRFVVVAVLLDSDGLPLSNPHTCLKYTQAYQDYLAKTIYDFDPSAVMNLDDAADNNFMVVCSETEILTTEAGFRLASADQEGGVYQFSGDSLPDFQPGENYALVDGEEIYLIAATAVTEQGETITVTAQEEPLLADFFDYVKIDTTVGVVGGTLDTSAPTSDQLHAAPLEFGSVEIIDEDQNGTLPLVFPRAELSSDHFKGGVTVSGDLSAHVKIQYDFKLFGKDYFLCEAWISGNLVADASITALVENSDSSEVFLDSIWLGRVDFPLGVTGLFAAVYLTIPVEWELSASAHASAEVNFRQGFTFNREDGYQPIDECYKTGSARVDGKASLTIGPKLEFNCNFMGIVVEVGVGIHTGVEVTAIATHPFYIVTNAPSAHACDLCVDGDVNAFIRVELDGSYHITSFLDGVFLDEEIPIVKEPVYQFYVSLINAPESIHKGSIKFGEGDCPNLVWRTSFVALDTEGNHSDAQITVARGDGTLVASGSSGMVEYLYDGAYTAFAEIDGKNYSVDFNVKGGVSEVVLQAEGDIVNNGGEYVQYQGKTYFWKYNAHSVSETGLFAYYPYQIDVNNQLVCRDEQGNMTTLYTGTGNGKLAIYDGKVYWNGYVDGKSCIYRMNLNGTGVETVLHQAELIAVDDQNGVLVCTISTSSGSFTKLLDLSTLTSISTAETIPGDGFLLLQDGVLYYQNNEAFSAKKRRMGATSLYAINTDGTGSRLLGSTPANLEDYITSSYAVIVSLQILDDYAYYTYGTYAGSSFSYQGGGLARARLDGSGVEVLAGEGSVSNNVGEIFLAAKNSARETVVYYEPYNGAVTDTPYNRLNLSTGKTTAVSQTPEFADTIWLDDKANVCIYQKDADTATTLMSSGRYLGYTPLLQVKSFDYCSWAEMEQAELVGDWLYYMVEHSDYTGENMGWRLGYKRISSTLYRYNLTTGENETVYSF